MLTFVLAAIIIVIVAVCGTALLTTTYVLLCELCKLVWRIVCFPFWLTAITVKRIAHKEV